MPSEADRTHIRLAELVAALSLGIDLGFGQPMEHVLRQCLIALRIAEGLGLDEDERAAVYYTALLINVGCHSDAHEQAKWFGDDIAVKSIKYDHDPRSLRMAATSMRFLGSGHPPLHRFRLGLEFALSGHREVDDMVEHHAAIARTLGEHLELSSEVIDALGAAYERWDGRGWPGDLEGDAVPLAARIASAAEYLEVASRIGGAQAARRLARKWRGGQFDPEVCDLVEAEADVILSGLDGVVAWDAVIEAEPALAVVVSGERFDAALLAIASFVDLKSPYFLGHSRAVADLTAEAGARLGLAEADLRTLRRAGLVARPRPAGHLERDLGQAAAPSAPASGSACACTRTSPSACCASPRRSPRWPHRCAASRAARRLGLSARAVRPGDLARGASTRRR